MIRIDEIYYNVFASAMQHRPRVGLHWFDPFGSTDFKDLVSFPQLNGAGHRIVFWDQEPMYRENAIKFFDLFCEYYRPPRDPDNHTTTTLVTSELHSEDLSWIQKTYNIENISYYFFHGWAALDWYRGYNHSYLAHPWTKREFKYPFICPNNIIGGRRIHRLSLLEELIDRGLVEQNLISFPEYCPYEKISARDLAALHKIDLKNCELPRIIDIHQNHANDSHRIDFWQQAVQAFAHIVTETVYTSDRLHLTEKTFKPIVMQQPFILVAPKNSLQYLKGYGFQTFSKIWDESYDTLPDDQRISAVADLATEISSWSEGHRKEMQREIADVVKHNHDWFYGGFQDRLWEELQSVIKQW